MKKLTALLLSIIIIYNLLPIYTYAASSYETAVSLSDVALSEWMKAIRGETKITELTVPGTHDSCARKFANEDVFGVMSGISKCQSLNITEQLNNGIRFLDIRCEVDADTHSVKTVHGSTDCWNGNDYYYLDFCFQDIYNWLDSHPSETVFVCIKEDDGDVGAPTFTSAIYEYIHGYGQNKYFYGESYNYNDYWYLGKSVPTLDTVRGKCVLFNRFDRYIASSGSTASEEESGQKVKWGTYDTTTFTSPVYITDQDWSSGAKYHVQDYYKWNTDNKKTATQEMLALGHYRGEYYINYSSTVSDSSVPNPENLAGKVNSGYATFTYDLDKPSGIFAMDFATGDLARYIIKNNEAVSNLVTGTDGNISYTINRLTHTLTISGSGAMNNYSLDSAKGVKGTGTTAPWSDQLKNSLFDGQYNTDIITNIVVQDGVTSIGDYAFYGFNNISDISIPSSVTSVGSNAVPENVSLDYFSLDAKASSVIREEQNPFAGKDLSKGVTINFKKYCASDRGWNTSIMSFSTGKNTDNRYFIIMANGTILFNDGNGGAGGWNNCYFDINSSAEVNSTSAEWVDIDITIDTNSSGNHILKYYINKALAKTYNLNSICASGYPSGVSGNNGVFSFLSSSDINLYYGASYSIYGTMAGTADCYLDKTAFYTYAKSTSQLSSEVSGSVYFNDFNSSLGGDAYTGREDGGYSVYNQQTDNNGRSGTAYFPYSNTGASGTNYVNTHQNPLSNKDLSGGATISYWQRINGNYYDNRESLTFAQGEIGENKYFTLGTDGYIRFNNGNGGSDSSLSSAGLYFDYTVNQNAIVKQTWQFITFEVIDDYNFKLYVNGVLKDTVNVSGTSQYQSTGGLMSFLSSSATTMYFGSYTPYWGTPTLSLDNVYVFDRALTNGEVYSLYLDETAGVSPEFENNFSSMPDVYGGESAFLSQFGGKYGVLHIMSSSADGDVTMTVDGTQTTDTARIHSGSAVTVSYTGGKQVVKWIKVVDGAISEVESQSAALSFNISGNTSVFCVLKDISAVDYSVYNAAVDYAATFDSAYYSSDSYNGLLAVLGEYSSLAQSSPSQAEIDNAAFDILSSISDLVPYLNLKLSSRYGSVVALYGNETASDGTHSLLFGTTLTLTASPQEEGYTFLGWYENDTKRIMSTELTYSFVLTSNTSLTAKFALSSEATLTFKNSSGWIKKQITKPVSYWAELGSISALLPELPYEYGKSGGYWAYNESEVLSALSSGQDTEIIASFSGEASLPEVPSAEDGVPVLSLTFNTDTENNVGSFILATGIPEGVNVEAVGIAVMYADAGTDLSSSTVTLNNKMLTSKFDVSEDNYYILDIRKLNAHAFAVRGYVSYYENGTLKTVYSNQINT